MPVHSSIHFLWTAGVLREGGVVRTALIRLFCIPLLHLDMRAFARSQTWIKCSGLWRQTRSRVLVGKQYHSSSPSLHPLLPSSDCASSWILLASASKCWRA